MLLRYSQTASDLIIALAYFTIPCWLLFSARARWVAKRANGQTWMLVLFGLFICSCGLGHLTDAFYEYRGICASLSVGKAIGNWITAMLSVGTAVFFVPRALNFMWAIGNTVDAATLQRRMDEFEKRYPNIDPES